MVGIGFGEMILIAGIALIVFGQEKFPDFAKIVLRTVNDLRGYVDEIQKEVTKEIKPIKRELEQLSKYDPEKYIDALSKDVKTAVESNPSTATTDKSESTEPQDDSCDYDAKADTTSSDAAPDDNLNDDDGTGDTATTASETEPAVEEETASTTTSENEAEPVVEAEAAPIQETPAVDPSDDLNFFKPPVERLD